MKNNVWNSVGANVPVTRILRRHVRIIEKKKKNGIEKN
jgi:hypothetical protein